MNEPTLRELRLHQRIEELEARMTVTMSAVVQLVRDVADLGAEVRRLSGDAQGAASCCCGEPGAERRQIDVFSAGCACCKRTVALVARIAAADGHELRVHDVRRERVARQAEALGIRVVPAVAVVAPGQRARRGEFAPLAATQLLAFSVDGSPDEAAIREALASH